MSLVRVLDNDRFMQCGQQGWCQATAGASGGDPMTISLEQLVLISSCLSCTLCITV